MKRILIISDSHKHLENLPLIMEKVGNVDLTIHCGDSECNDDEIRALVKSPLYIVAGNNDFFYNYEKELFVEVDHKKILITHGNYYYVTIGTEILVRDASARRADVVVFGHTHRPYNHIIGGMHVVNPGSMSFPRQDGGRPSFALVTIDDNGEIDTEIHYLDMQCVRY